MTSKASQKRDTQPKLHDVTTHRFKVGQSVRFEAGLGGAPGSGGVYRITGTLPPLDNSPQYRIRSESERHERVVTQDRLWPLGATQSDGRAALIERTFGHGQGTEKK